MIRTNKHEIHAKKIKRTCAELIHFTNFVLRFNWIFGNISPFSSVDTVVGAKTEEGTWTEIKKNYEQCAKHEPYVRDNSTAWIASEFEWIFSMLVERGAMNSVCTEL